MCQNAIKAMKKRFVACKNTSESILKAFEYAGGPQAQFVSQPQTLSHMKLPQKCFYKLQNVFSSLLSRFDACGTLNHNSFRKHALEAM